MEAKLVLEGNDNLCSVIIILPYGWLQKCARLKIKLHGHNLDEAWGKEIIANNRQCSYGFGSYGDAKEHMIATELEIRRISEAINNPKIEEHIVISLD